MAPKHPSHLPLCTCRPPFRRRCRHNHHHLNASRTSATSLTPSPYNPDFATQTGGAKGALAPTISVRPPFAHPPPLCRLFHLRGCPRCAPWFTCPAPCPILSHPTRHPPLHARGCRRDSAPLVPSSQAMPHARGRAAHKGRGKDQGGCTQGEGLHARGGGGCVSERGCTRTEGGTHPFRTPCAQ